MVLLSLGGALITGGTLMTKLFNTKFFSFFFFSSYQEPKARRADLPCSLIRSSSQASQLFNFANCPDWIRNVFFVNAP